LGGVRLISSARIMLAKMGPLVKRQPLVPSRIGVLEDLGARDVGGHQVRRELDALELQIEQLRQRFDQQRLGQARRAGEQAMAARDEHRDRARCARS
jgi:hypothetical protein